MRIYLKPPDDVFCPQFKDWRGRPSPMSKCCPKCVKWMHIRGKPHDQPDEVDGYNCADVYAVLAQFETTQMVRQFEAKQTTELNALKEALTTRLDRSFRAQVLAIEEQRQNAPAIPLQETKGLPCA